MTAVPMAPETLSKAYKKGILNAYISSAGKANRDWVRHISPVSNTLSNEIMALSAKWMRTYLTTQLTLERLVAPVQAGEADVVVGSRYIGGVRIMNWPLSRLILSYSAGIYTRAITRMKLQDVTAGFKCFRREVLEAIDLSSVRSNGYSFQIEMNYIAWKKGFRLMEVPIVFTERTEGLSKMSKAIVREAMWKVWELRFRSLFGRL